MSSRGKMPCSLKLLPRKNHLLRIRNPARRDLAQLPITPGVNLVLVKGGSGTSRSKRAQKAAGHPRSRWFLHRLISGVPPGRKTALSFGSILRRRLRAEHLFGQSKEFFGL